MRIIFSVLFTFILWAGSSGLGLARGSLVFPQFVNGEAAGVANRTRIILRNNCATADRGVIRFRDRGGNPVAVPLAGSSLSEREFEIGAWGVFDQETGGTGPLVSGSIEVQSNRGAESCLEGSVAYDILGSQVSADSSPQSAHHQVYASRDSTEAAGMAIYNPSPDATVRIEALLVDEQGMLGAERTLEIGPREQISEFIDQASLFAEFFEEHPGDFRGTVNLNTVFDGSRFPEVSVLGLIQNSVTNRLTAVAASRQAFARFQISNLAVSRTNLRLSASQIVFDIPIRVDFQDETETAPSEDLVVAFEVGDPFFGAIPDPQAPEMESGFRVVRPLASAAPAASGTLEFFLHRVVAPELLQTGIVRPVAVPIKLSMSNAMQRPSNELSTYVLVDAGGVVEGLDGAAGVAISPDGSHVYAASRTDDAIAIFARDPDNGTLRFVEAVFDSDPVVDGLDGVDFVAVSPDGRNLYTLSSSTHSLALFGRDADSGELTFLGSFRDGQAGANRIREPSCLAVSPDGTQVYVTSRRDDALTVFARDPETGLLEVSAEFVDNTAGVDGLDGASFVAVSPDGASVYVSSATDDAVAVFGRQQNGMLTFLEVFFNGAGNVIDGLEGASSLSVSPDGLRVYAAAELDNALTVFARNPDTGRLTFLTGLFDGVGGIDGLDGADALAISPDSRHVYVASNDDNALAVFERSPSGGALRFVGALRDGVGGVDGLREASSVTISPDGRHLYVAGAGDDGVAVFQRDPQTGFLLFLEARLEGQGLAPGTDPGHKF